MGMDGLDPIILEEMMAKGKLPNFSRLAAKGLYHPLETVFPPQSPVVWTSIATGCPPLQHSIHDFLSRDPGDYTPKLSVLRQGKLGYVRPFAGKTFWEVASAREIPATVIKWPLTFPATPMMGTVLSGLGTPDIRGTLGRYTFISSSDVPNPEKKKGTVLKVDASRGVITTLLPGPLGLSFQGKVETNTPLEIQRDNGRILCRLGGASFSLEEGCWSAWIPVTFKVGFMRTVTGICRFYLESVEPDFNLYVTPINLDPQMKFMPLSYPLAYARQLADALGSYATLGLAEDANALNDEIISERGFLSGCDLVMKEREKIFFHELSRFHQGILACVFDTTDRVQHLFWRHLDQDHPRYNPQEAREYGAVIPGWYLRVDDVLGRVLERLADNTLLIVASDHGFTSFRRSVHLNTWLVQNGFMVLREEKTAGSGLFADVDWSRTVAFAFGLNSLCLNLTNREKQGCLDGERLAAVKEDLVRRLLVMTDQGRPVINDVSDSGEFKSSDSAAPAPDLVVGYAAGYRTSWQTALGEAPGGDCIEDNLAKWSGDHCCAPQLVPGIFLSNQKNLLGKPHVLDICPAILDFLT
ncbi:MAG: alkaline phosphatase family protein [Thermodesulfobacteriota bacterium]